MRPAVWILLVTLCASLARMSVVDLSTERSTCDCCGAAGDCGMPDCAPPPAATQPGSNVTWAVGSRVAPQPGLARTAAVQMAAVRVPRDSLDASTAFRTAASWRAIRATPVPLFAEHCSWLI